MLAMMTRKTEGTLACVVRSKGEMGRQSLVLDTCMGLHALSNGIKVPPCPARRRLDTFDQAFEQPAAW